MFTVHHNHHLSNLPASSLSIRGLEMVFVHSGVDVAFSREKLQRTLHLPLGHLGLDLAEQLVLVEPRVVHTLPDAAVHEVVLRVPEGLGGHGASHSLPTTAALAESSSHHHRVGQTTSATSATSHS